MISRIIQTEVNVICNIDRGQIILDIMRKPNPIIVLLYIQNSHTKMQEKYGSKKTHAINLAKFCYFVIFGHLWPIIHSIRRK